MFLYILFIITYVSFVSTDNFCGNWKSFKDEKCVHVFNEEKLVTYEEAVELCSQSENSSTLITIHSNEEQEFFEKYLFETQKIVDSVWLGLKNSNNKFEWIDKTSVEFTNWANGFPSNKSDHKCVEMISETSPIGKWYDIQCTKKNIAVCQRPLVLTFDMLRKKLSETEDLLNKSKEDLKNSQKQLKEITLKMNQKVNFGWFTSNPFTDSDEKIRALIFPENENKNRYEWNEANNICLKYNATLVEINSQLKQNFLESFFYQLNSTRFNQFWLNGHRDSSGKWKWLRSGNQFTFTNWYTSYPYSNGLDNLYFALDNAYDKWANYHSTCYIICELELKL